MGGKRRTNKDFLEEVKKLIKDEYTFLEEFINVDTNILCRHNKCGYEWKISPYRFLKLKNRCPKCNKVAKKKHMKLF